MDRRRNLSESGDDSDASDDSIELPPSFKCDGSKPEEILQRKHKVFDTFQRSSEELKSEYDRNLPTLTDQIKKLKDITDEIESVLRKATVGILAGASVGAVGGISALAGLALAPFTFGLSLSLTVAGVVAGAAGGVTRAASNFTNMLKQRKPRQTTEKIISDFLETIKPMTKPLNIISNITADIQQNNEMLNKMEFQTAVRGFHDLVKIVKAADLALVGKYCAEAAKEIRVYVKTASAVRDPAQAARAVFGAAGAVKGAICYFSALKISDITISLLYIFFSCVLTSSRQFPRTFKSGENYSLIRRHGTFLYFRFVARLWRHINFDPSSLSNFLRNRQIQR